MPTARLGGDGDNAAAMSNNNKNKATPTKTFDHKMLMIVFVALVIDLLAFTMILPLLPALLDYYGQNEQVSCGDVINVVTVTLLINRA